MDQTRDAGAFIVVEALIGKITALRWTEGVLSPDWGGQRLSEGGDDILDEVGVLIGLKIGDCRLVSSEYDFSVSGINHQLRIRWRKLKLL